MKAKKFIEKKKEGEYELIKNHVIDVPETINIEWICDKLNLYDEDAENAYVEFGICFDEDGGIFFINSSKFITGVSNNIHESDADEYEEEDVKKIFANLELIKKYKDYDIYL